MLRIGILGSGSGTNMQSIIDAIAAQTLNARVVCVISDVPDAYILQRAARHQIAASYIDPAPHKSVLAGHAEEQVIATLLQYQVDTVVLAGFMRIVKRPLLQAFPQRVLNIHPALLPAFPGLQSWQQALEYGAKITGCTVHFVDDGIDTGPIILQRCVPINDGDTPETLHARIQIEEHRAYPEALRLLADKRLQIQGRRVLHLPRKTKSD